MGGGNSSSTFFVGSNAAKYVSLGQKFSAHTAGLPFLSACLETCNGRKHSKSLLDAIWQFRNSWPMYFVLQSTLKSCYIRNNYYLAMAFLPMFLVFLFQYLKSPSEHYYSSLFMNHIQNIYRTL